MSFSFSVVGPTKEDVMASLEAEMTEVVSAQANHAHDRSSIESVVDIYLGLLDDRAEGVFHVSVSGSVGWLGSMEQPVYNGAGVSVSVRKVPA
jgi:hypothetical protein